MKKNKITYNLHNKDTKDRVNKAIKREKERDGLWKTKQQITDKKYNDYCKATNTKNTNGGWKNKVYGATKSEWQRKWETEYEKMARKYKDKKKEITIKTHEAVILYDKENDAADAYNAEVEKKNGEIVVKIIYGRRKLKVKAHEEEIESEKLLELALKHRASIYIIDEIIEK